MAGIKDLHFHTLRREAASRRFEDGMPLQHVRDLLGHADISTPPSYTQVSRSRLRKGYDEFHPRASRRRPRGTPKPRGGPRN